MAALDWAAVVAYVLFALAVGVFYARRAGKNVDEFFLSGRTLPWWITGTSMIATSFASDTPLLISGWVRDFGIWKNWVWWCYAVSGMFMVFLFARYWRAGRIMTKAELVELRYPGAAARALRGGLGAMHAFMINPLILSWVLLAAAKILGGLFGIDKIVGLSLACGLALSYSLMAGFWGVVITDLVQFLMAMVGAIVLAMLAWRAVGGTDAIHDAVADGTISSGTLDIIPEFGANGMSAAFAGFLVYLGVAWWVAENADGPTVAVQRIAASRNERHGMLASLWFHVGHYALRPWCWIAVGLASLLVLPQIEWKAPTTGQVTAAEEGRVVIKRKAGGSMALSTDPARDWKPIPTVQVGDDVKQGDVIAKTDSERAYVVMMKRYLPIGLLGLVVASLLAAFMSTVDTHVNLASSYFVNDLYRRWWKREASDRHYVGIARIVSVVVLLAGGLVAWQADSIARLFEFFLAFLGGVGPVYLMRWFWWRVRASTEITAMVASAITAITIQLKEGRIGLDLGPLSPDGKLGHPGTLCVVAVVSVACALIAMVLARRPDPASLVPFYKRVRPIGAWGPVRALARDVTPIGNVGLVIGGALSGLALVWGGMLGIGYWMLGYGQATAVSFAMCAAGGVGTACALRRLVPKTSAEPQPE